MSLLRHARGGPVRHQRSPLATVGGGERGPFWGPDCTEASQRVQSSDRNNAQVLILVALSGIRHTIPSFGRRQSITDHAVLRPEVSFDVRHSAGELSCKWHVYSVGPP